MCRHTACHLDLDNEHLAANADARQKVIEVAGALRRPARRETIEIEHAVWPRAGARSARGFRDYPPFNGSTRDGFAVRPLMRLPGRSTEASASCAPAAVLTALSDRGSASKS